MIERIKTLKGFLLGLGLRQQELTAKNNDAFVRNFLTLFWLGGGVNLPPPSRIF